MLEIKITFDPTTGQMQIVGPTQDKILCCGLFEMAKSVILSQEKKSGLVLPVLTRVPKNGENG